MKTVLSACLCGALLAWAARAAADPVDDDLAVVAQAGADGDAAAIRAARDRLATQGVDILPRLLSAMNTDNPVVANWYRTAWNDIVARELERSEPQLPLDDFEAFLGDSENRGPVRRLVLRLVERLRPGYAEEWIPTRLDDPEFRDEAVARTLKRGDDAKQRGDTEAARAAYASAFRHARDSGQVTQAASRLGSVGEEVSIIEHMGFVIDWYLLGPFDAPGKTGFDLSFPPETAVDLEAEYDGKDSARIGWTRHRTDDVLGQVNLIRAVAPVKEAVGYAYTEIHSPKKQQVELRCGADDNLTVWLNGELAFRRLQWLNGTRLDRFTAPVTLQAGVNRLLVKVCQGPQHSNPAVPNNWSLQLRFCNADGVGVGVTSALPPVEETAQ